MKSQSHGSINGKSNSRNMISSKLPKSLRRKIKKSTNNLPLSARSDISETIIIGAVADLLEEVKKLLTILRKRKKSKRESSQIFRSLLSHYYPLIGVNYRDIISLFIYDTSKNCYHIQLPLDEIRSWWHGK